MVDKITSPVGPNELIAKTNEIIDNLGGSGTITVDQTYSATSANAQSGVAINGAKFLQNTATGTGAITINGVASAGQYALNIGESTTASANYTTALGYKAKASGSSALAIGRVSTASGSFAIAMGYGATASGGKSIQLGFGTNTTAASMTVGFQDLGNYQLLDGNTGLIPDDRLSSSIARATAIPTSTTQLTNDSGFITGITSGDVTTALGFTPYSNANPSGYQANVLETVKVNGTALTPSSKTVDVTVPTSTTQLTNDSGFITNSALSGYQTTANLVTTISNTSTDTKYPSAKAVYSVVHANETAIAGNTSAISANTSAISANTSAIEGINSLIPSGTSSSNQLADKSFVNSSISTNTANFIGTFASVAELNAYSGTKTNNDYAFVTSTDTAGNTVYNRYKYVASTTTWTFEYALNNSSFTADQWAAVNSGITSSTKVTHTSGTAVGNTITPVYIASTGAATALSYTIAKSVPSDAKFTDTTYSQGTGISISGTTINHSNSVTAGTAGGTAAASGSTVSVPYVTYDAQGHITASGTRNHTVTGFMTSVSSTDITSALGYTPYNGSTNPNGYLTSVSSTDITSALGYTPYNGSTNPNGYLTSVSPTDIINGIGYTPENVANKITTLSSSSTDTQYPSAKCVYDSMIKATYDSSTQTLYLQ